MTEATPTDDTWATDLTRHKRGAMLAASLASDATTELLRFNLEGPICNWPFGDAAPIEKLAEALLHAGRLEVQILEAQPMATEYRDGLGQLAAACVKFLEDHCSGSPVLLGVAEDIPESEVPY
ncbi:hypothetical protein [Novosphingobium sp. ST904]|uniref:hypothetical protein n=1 Tax=Novosphingobium sp. ST904 TaxID=1684385 RepID=UPI0006C875E4|nr:hypothetical protein [Novosphingobium sp. ST904]KPH66353.1 hypothetical protein ADT71_06710 [Novosphingobium sp. ST904]TCM42066.1 hypothetical protein EDF59_10226 [Novosphingobium sp. ST904]